VAGLAGAYVGRLAGSLTVALAVGVAAAGSKLAFDSIVQRDAPDANRGRSFARFETRFQLVWVLGALIPVVLPEQVEMPARLGFLCVAGAAAFALASYLAGAKAVAAGKPIPERGLDRKARKAARRAVDRLREKKLDGRRPPPSPKPALPPAAPTPPALPPPPPPPTAENTRELTAPTMPAGSGPNLPALPDPTLVEDATLQQPPPPKSDDTTIIVDPTNL
jgi:hypothetical protein